MTEFQHYTDLAGSERAPHPNATRTGELVTEGEISVTIAYEPGHAEAVTRFLVAHGLSIERADVPGFVRVSGPAPAIQDAFQTPLEHAVTEHGVRFRQRTGPVRIPAELDGVITAVLGLDDRPVAKPYFRQLEGILSHAGQGYTPAQVAQIYAFPAGNGDAKSVAVVELGGGYSDSDLTAAGIDPALVQFVSVDGATNAYGDASGASGEVGLDLQVIGAIAPKVRQYCIMAPNNDASFLNTFLKAISLGVTAISCSWGQSEAGWTPQSMQAYEKAFQQAAAAGIAVFAAAGDNGSGDSQPGQNADFPASAPSCTGCGGTNLTPQAEVVWNDAGGGATGGGYSKVFGRPSWQAGNSNNMRGVPDVAGDASPQTGYRVYLGGWYVYGGTSAVAPLYAALTALLAQQTGKRFGGFNSIIYGLPAGTFRDITSGNNGAFAAATGWDACTGLGSPDGAKLLAALSGSGQQPQPTPTPQPLPDDPLWPWLRAVGEWGITASGADRKAEAKIVDGQLKYYYPGLRAGIKSAKGAPVPPGGA